MSVKSSLWRRAISGLVCLSLLAIPSRAKADRLKNAAVGAGVAIGAVGIGIGIGLYYLIHSGNNLRGCVAEGPGGLELRQKDDPQVWTLVGDVGSIKPGERILVAGKRKKKNAVGTRQFVVEKLGKDYGPCS